MIAWLEGHVESRSPSLGAGFLQRHDLGVPIAGARVVTRRDQAPIFDDDATHMWVGGGVAEMANLHGLRHPLTGPAISNDGRWFGSPGAVIDHVSDLAFRTVANKLAHLQHEGIDIAK